MKKQVVTRTLFELSNGEEFSCEFEAKRQAQINLRDYLGYLIAESYSEPFYMSGNVSRMFEAIKTLVEDVNIDKEEE